MLKKGQVQKLEIIFRRILDGAEKIEFVRTAVAWISDKDIVDTCFVLNFGYDDPLPWPQV